MNKEYIVSGSWDSRSVKSLFMFKVGHFKQNFSSVFEFGTDVRERFCFFTPIHMEGKTFFGSIKSTRSHNAMAFWLAQDCREHSIFVFSDGQLEIVTP